MKSSSCFILFVTIIVVVSSCSLTKHVPENKYLLDKYEIKTDNGKIDKDEIKNYVRQQPNKKILGMKFHLSVYNLSRKDKDNWINRWLRSIGEEPVIFDKYARQKSASQIQLYLRNKGYYNSSVRDTTLLKKQKATNSFNITLNEPYRIRSINYKFEDSTLESYIFSDTAASLLKRGQLFDVDVLSEERERIEFLLKNKGFYNFSKEYIFFNADSSAASNQVDFTMVIKKFTEALSPEEFHEIAHPRYKIGQVYINTDYKPREVMSNDEQYFASLDTTITDNIHIIFSGEPGIKPSVATSVCYIIPGQFFQLNNVNRTYRHISSLQLFRLITIDFRDSRNTDKEGARLLDCHIDLAQFTLQSFAAEVEGTNSSGNIGAAGNLIYQHRNLFTGAENFDMKLKGAVETIKETREYNFGNMIEFGAEASLRFPKFLLPFHTEQYIRQFSPFTRLSVAYNYQRRPDYVRTIANASFSYNWRGNRYLTHSLSPVELNLVKIPYKSQQFIDWLEGKYIYYSYQPHLITVTSYSVVYSNQNIQKSTDFVYVRFNGESAGNLLYSVYKAGGVDDSDGSYALFNTDFSQYVRGDIDFRFYNIVDENNSFVYRIFAGAGYPYKNSTALPFEKKYFSGGANSIRAWQVRNLGPGSYKDPDPGYYPNQTADIKLEANLEYRFKMFWLLEGALFIDAGNIWSITSIDDREGALFEWNKFYKDIAIGTGFGARFDFSFFIFRLDLGIKAMDPAAAQGNKWIIGSRRLTRNDLTLNLGIGYPF